MARKTDYDSAFHDEEAYNVCLLGFTAKQLAEHFGVSHQTIKNWFKLHPSFFASVNRGRTSADGQVAVGLFKKATGFTIDSEQLLVVKTSRDTEEVKREPTKTYYPPDAGAAMNWLKNRQPELWRDKQDLGLSGDFTFTLNLDGDGPSKVEEEDED